MRCQLSSSAGRSEPSGVGRSSAVISVSGDADGARIRLPEAPQRHGQGVPGVVCGRAGAVHRDVAGDSGPDVARLSAGLHAVSLIVVVHQAHGPVRRDAGAVFRPIRPPHHAVAGAADRQRRAAHGQQRRLLAVGAGDGLPNGVPFRGDVVGGPAAGGWQVRGGHLQPVHDPDRRQSAVDVDADGAGEVHGPVVVQVREPVADHGPLPPLLFQDEVLDRPLAKLDTAAQRKHCRAAGMCRAPRSVTDACLDHRQRLDRAGRDAHAQRAPGHGHGAITGRTAQTVGRRGALRRGTDGHGAGLCRTRGERSRQRSVDQHPARRPVRPEGVRPALNGCGRAPARPSVLRRLPSRGRAAPAPRR